MSRNEGNISSCQIGGKAFIEELYHNIDKSDVAQYVSGVTVFYETIETIEAIGENFSYL